MGRSAGRQQLPTSSSATRIAIAPQTVEIPIGPNNKIEPGGPDYGQPTVFEPGRQTTMFAIKVPKDFGKQKLTWTLVANGQPAVVTFYLNPEYNMNFYKEESQRQRAAEDEARGERSDDGRASGWHHPDADRHGRSAGAAQDVGVGRAADREELGKQSSPHARRKPPTRHRDQVAIVDGRVIRCAGGRGGRGGRRRGGACPTSPRSGPRCAGRARSPCTPSGVPDGHGRQCRPVVEANADRHVLCARGVRATCRAGRNRRRVRWSVLLHVRERQGGRQVASTRVLRVPDNCIPVLRPVRQGLTVAAYETTALFGSVAPGCVRVDDHRRVPGQSGTTGGEWRTYGGDLAAPDTRRSIRSTPTTSTSSKSHGGSRPTISDRYRNSSFSRRR